MRKLRVAIVGGGIGGLSAGFYLKKKFDNDVEIKIFEKGPQLGGTIGITREKDYLADWGPNGFLDREPLTLELIEQLGLTDQLVRANDQSEKRFIFRGGRLREIKSHPIKFMTSDLLSVQGRLRLLRELFVPAKKNNDDETIFDFATRRLGLEAAQVLIDPMVTGIFGGDAQKLSLGACFAKMEMMEREHGSLFKAMIAKKNSGGPSGPGGRLTTFAGGFYTLIERLNKHLGTAIQLNSNVEELQISDQQIELQINNERQRFDKLILAVPAYAAGKLLNTSTPSASEILKQTPYCGMAVVCQGYRVSHVDRKLDGFGFLIPRQENRKILGSIWSSVIFPNQAPAGEVLLRTMLTDAQQEPSTLAKIAQEELSEIMGIHQPPRFEKIIRWQQAIPQYRLGHRQRLSRIESILAQDNQIHLAGNAYTGVGLNDVIKRSHDMVHYRFITNH